MLAFLCLSSYVDPNMSLDDIKNKDVVFVLGELEPKMSQRVSNEISGEKFSLVPNSILKTFHLQSYSKGNVKIGGFSLKAAKDDEIKNFFIEEESLNVLLLDEEPTKNDLVMTYIKERQPKFVFYNSAIKSKNMVCDTRIIGLPLFAVERFYTS